jgi:ribosomal protein L25 (general stress protein Ctc)
VIIIKWKRWTRTVLGLFKVTITANDLDKALTKCEKAINWSAIDGICKKIGLTDAQIVAIKDELSKLDLVKVVAI